MKIEEQFPVLHIAPGGRMRIANEKMSAGMFARVGSNARQHVQPAGVPRIVLVHQTHLAEMDRLDSHIDVAGHQEIKPHARFQSAHVRDGAVSSPVVHETATRVKHVLVTKSAIGRALAELVQNPLRNGNRFHASRDDLKRGRLQDDFRISLMQRRRVRLRRSEKRRQIPLPPPNHERTAPELCFCTKEQTHVVARRNAPAAAWEGQIVMKQFSELDGAREVNLQYRPVHGRIEMEILGCCRESPNQAGGDEEAGQDSGFQWPDLKPFHRSRMPATAIPGYPMRAAPLAAPPTPHNPGPTPAAGWRSTRPPSPRGAAVNWARRSAFRRSR